MAERGGQVMWEYFVDNGVDGKANGWCGHHLPTAMLPKPPNLATSWKLAKISRTCIRTPFKAV